uniref:Uncharacterized protein n=1 Tax=Anguilla anguilla TaxID=7936 RepID=A0A0E9WKG4_ANGAN
MCPLQMLEVRLKWTKTMAKMLRRIVLNKNK